MKQRITQIKPAGWLAIGVLVALMIGLGGLLIQPLAARPLPASDLIGTVATPRSGAQAAWTPTPDRRSPTAIPLPDGWAQKTDLTGQPYIAPPADVEVQLKEAFSAVLACYYAEDAEDAVLQQQPDRVALCETATQHAVASYAASIDANINMREIDTFGPINPPRCTGTTTCSVARAKLEVKGSLMYGDICDQIGQTSPCVVREGISGLKPYQLHIATMKRQENGSWKVVAWNTEQLPEPPSSP